MLCGINAAYEAQSHILSERITTQMPWSLEECIIEESYSFLSTAPSILPHPGLDSTWSWLVIGYVPEAEEAVARTHVFNHCYPITFLSLHLMPKRDPLWWRKKKPTPSSWMGWVKTGWWRYWVLACPQGWHWKVMVKEHPPRTDHPAGHRASCFVWKWKLPSLYTGYGSRLH